MAVQPRCLGTLEVQGSGDLMVLEVGKWCESRGGCLGLPSLQQDGSLPTPAAPPTAPLLWAWERAAS